MYAFNYHRPKSLADAAKLLGDASDGKFIAGGQTLLPTLKNRLASPSDLVDLTGIAELSGISVSGGTVSIGAITNALGTEKINMPATPQNVWRVLQSQNLAAAAE